jgi:GNAT superfamily N-acetyltransferase
VKSALVWWSVICEALILESLVQLKTKMEPLIRIAIVEDLNRLVPLYQQLNLDDKQAKPEHLASVFQEILSSRYFKLVVAELEGELVGTCYLNIIPNLSRAASPYAVIENVIVTQYLRRQGIGKAIIKFALTQAWHHGCYKVMLQTGSKSHVTYRFYRSCGFSQTQKVAFVAKPSKG